MDLKATYNKIAKDWMQDHHGDTWWVEGTDKFLSFLPSDSSVLDAGCGAGVKSEYLVKNGCKVTGIDFSESMIELAESHVPDAAFFVRDIIKPLELEQSFDGVFAQAVLLHIPKNIVTDVVKNIIQPLKSGGYFYAAVKEVKQGESVEQVVKENGYGYEYERFFSYYSAEELKTLVAQAGLEIIWESVTSSGKTNWLQVIAKKV